MKIVILYSGGLDSVVLNRWAHINYPNSDIVCIYYDYGNPVCMSEIKHLPDFVQVRKIQWFENSQSQLIGKPNEQHKGNIYIPGRNLVFAILAATQELPDCIFMGGLYEESHNNATDKNSTFIRLTNDTLSYVLGPFKDGITLRFPFVEEKMFKKDVINWALGNGITPEEIGSAYSCFNATENSIPCGECHSCIRSFSFFYIANIPIKFIKHPFIDTDFGNSYILSSIISIELLEYNSTELLYDIEYESILKFYMDNYTTFSNFLEANDIIARLKNIISHKTYEHWI